MQRYLPDSTLESPLWEPGDVDIYFDLQGFYSQEMVRKGYVDGEVWNEGGVNAEANDLRRSIDKFILPQNFPRFMKMRYGIDFVKTTTIYGLSDRRPQGGGDRASPEVSCDWSVIAYTVHGFSSESSGLYKCLCGPGSIKIQFVCPTRYRSLASIVEKTDLSFNKFSMSIRWVTSIPLRVGTTVPTPLCAGTTVPTPLCAGTTVPTPCVAASVCCVGPSHRTPLKVVGPSDRTPLAVVGPSDRTPAPPVDTTPAPPTLTIDEIRMKPIILTFQTTRSRIEALIRRVDTYVPYEKQSLDSILTRAEKYRTRGFVITRCEDEPRVESDSDSD
jgi:hypothetical protein